MVPQVNCDYPKHSVYQQGCSLRPDRVAVWMDKFASHAFSARPLTVFYLGSGRGRSSRRWQTPSADWHTALNPQITCALWLRQSLRIPM